MPTTTTVRGIREQAKACSGKGLWCKDRGCASLLLILCFVYSVQDFLLLLLPLLLASLSSDDWRVNLARSVLKVEC